MKQIIIIFLLIFINSAAFAHSQLTEILPEDNVTYNDAPPQIEMKFKSEVKLVKIDLIRVDIKEKIKLDSSLLKNKSTNYSIPMPKLDEGIYRFEWRALSPDGHIIKGKSDFEVK
jgi:methionine-rich copper-binding protein CopC